MGGVILDLFDFIANHIPALAGIALALSVVFQVTKIPINPWGWLLDKVSDAITKQVRLQLDEIEKDKDKSHKEILNALSDIRSDIAEIYKILDDDKIENIRGEILNFADSIHAGDNHSREQYHRIIERNNEYHQLIEKYKVTNGVLDLAMQAILNSYQEHEEKNDFIA